MCLESYGFFSLQLFISNTLLQYSTLHRTYLIQYLLFTFVYSSHSHIFITYFYSAYVIFQLQFSSQALAFMLTLQYFILCKSAVRAKPLIFTCINICAPCYLLLTSNPYFDVSYLQCILCAHIFAQVCPVGSIYTLTQNTCFLMKPVVTC